MRNFGGRRGIGTLFFVSPVHKVHARGAEELKEEEEKEEEFGVWCILQEQHSQAGQAMHGTALFGINVKILSTLMPWCINDDSLQRDFKNSLSLALSLCVCV